MNIPALSKGAKLRGIEVKVQGVIDDLRDVVLALHDLEDLETFEFFDNTANGLRFYLDGWRIKHGMKAPYVYPPPPLTIHHD